jgi:hypothetical protein
MSLFNFSLPRKTPSFFLKRDRRNHSSSDRRNDSQSASSDRRNDSQSASSDKARFISRDEFGKFYRAYSPCLLG